MPDSHDLGRTIARYRRQLKLSQTEFGGLIGRSESWVSQVERGVRSLDRLSVLQTVADALSVSVAELQGNADAEEDKISERPEAFETLRLSSPDTPPSAPSWPTKAASTPSATLTTWISAGRPYGPSCTEASTTTWLRCSRT
jgi:transcriptional regulator with XRE-family HTH domain